MLLRGKPAWSVEMFAVLLVLTLVPTLSDGLLLKKCDLKSQLERALPDLQGKNNEEMIAKLVCTLGHISGFNTSLVTIIDQFNNRLFLQGNDEEYSSEIEEFPLTFISDQDTALPEDYNGQVRKRSDAPSIDGGDGSGEASIDQSEENKGVDHGPTDLPPDTTVKPTDTIYYDTFEMLFGFTTSPPETTEEPTDPIYYDDFDMLYGFTNSPPDTSEEHVDYYGGQVRKRRDAPSMDGGDGSGEASIDQSEENKGVDHGPTDLPPDTTVKPTDTIYYDTFAMLFGFTTSPPETTEEPTDPIYYDDFDMLYGFTNSPPDTSEEHVDYYDDQVRKRRDAPSIDGGDGSGEASIDQSEENKGVDHGPTDLPPDTTVKPTDTIYYDTFEMLFGFTTSPPETTEEPTDPIYYDDFDMLYGSTNSPPDTSEEHVDYYNGQVRKRRDAPSIDGGDGSGEASIDQSEENKGVDHGPTDLPPDTTVKPTDTIYYDTFEMLFGFTTSPPETTEEPTDPIYYDDFDMLYGSTNSPPDTSEEHVDYYDDQVRKRRDAPSIDGGDGSGEASSDQSEENNGVDHGPTDLPPDTTVKPTDTIYYDTFEMLSGFTTSPPETTEEPTDPIYYDDFDMLYGFTNSPPDTSEEHVDYYGGQVRKRRDAPSMDGGDGSGEASIDQSEENKGVENALQLDTIEPLESDVKQRSKRNAKAQTTFYGIFQLSDIACESGSSPSQNLCGLSCSALTDDDISDDIACLRDLLNSKIEKIFTQECLSVDPSVYFTTCG